MIGLEENQNENLPSKLGVIRINFYNNQYNSAAFLNDMIIATMRTVRSDLLELVRTADKVLLPCETL